jgi:putative CocE/NonD family hydrolase
VSTHSSWFQRFLLPGFAFKAVVIGGGYATGRELVEFFLPSGPRGGVLGILLAMIIWSVVCAVTFLFARATQSQDYRTFFANLLGPFGFVFEIAYLLFIIVILAVFGAAAGELGHAAFGWPKLAGTLCLMSGITAFVTYGNASVERLFKWVSFFLYGVYAIFIALALTTFGDRILANFALPTPTDGWALGGLTYAGYNIVGAVVVLPVLRHLTSRKDAVVAGLLAGPLAMLPAFLFFICMVAYYPRIGSEALPSDFLLQTLNLPVFHLIFRLMIFAALLESGTGTVHAINERIAHSWQAQGRKPLAKSMRLAITVALLVGSIFLADRFGLVTLIARGYRWLAYVLLAVYVLPLMTVGLSKLWTERVVIAKAMSFWILVLFAALPWVSFADETPPPRYALQVNLKWGEKIPMRDGVRLNATVYLPREQKAPGPCIFTLTPYISQSYHDRGLYFAAHGLPFLTVDVRGRGNSEGEFAPFIQEAHDGYDVVEWLARQPYCNGKISMWGGSYAGYDQWVTAKEFPPHLATIVPVASPYAGMDFPMRGNILSPYLMQWLTMTSGRTSQAGIFGDLDFWNSKYQQLIESGAPFKNFDTQIGNPSPIFQTWVQHPTLDTYWDSQNPTAEQYAKLSIPILTITASYDDDQPGAMMHYRTYMANASPEARARHFLVIGPWDHSGTRTPQPQVGGVTFGPASMVDLPKLHLDWYAWTMQGGAKPDFLKKNVAYYVTGAERWRYADKLEDVTSEARAYHLDSQSNANDLLASGSLSAETAQGKPDHYVYDPKDVGAAAIEAETTPGSLIDQTMFYAQRGKLLVYHTAPFEKDTEISGFFKLSAWIGIDRPDTDFAVFVYEVRPDGSAVLLTTDVRRARYRENLREAKLITSAKPLRYDFDGFTFTSRQVRKGSRLRLIVTPDQSIYQQKNYNTGGDVSAESMKDAKPVTVTLYHNRQYPSALYVPIGQPER